MVRLSELVVRLWTIEAFHLHKLMATLPILFAIHIAHSRAEPLLFSIVGLKQETSSFRIVESISTEIAARCRTDIRLIELPPQREIEYLLSGELDGSIARPDDEAENIPGLIRVLEPTATVPIYAYAKNLDIEIDGWDSLKNYRAAYVADLLYGEPHRKRNKKNDFSFTDVAGALNFLASGRADVFIHSPFGVESLLRTDEFKSSGIAPLQPAVDVFSTYTFVLPKHAELAKCFNTTLKKMKQDKSYEKILSSELSGN